MCEEWEINCVVGDEVEDEEEKIENKRKPGGARKQTRQQSSEGTTKQN
jgi:hypothetical protein